MKHSILLLFALIIMSCKPDVKLNKKESSEKKLDTISHIESFKYDGLEKYLKITDDKTYVINFWATWCKPCVEELPAFEKLLEKYKNKKVEVILVSLDFPNQIENRVIPFINKHKLQSKVVLMADTDQNTWIPKVNENWSGAIPATLIYNKNLRKFYEQSFTFELLETELLTFIKN